MHLARSLIWRVFYYLLLSLRRVRGYTLFLSRRECKIYTVGIVKVTLKFSPEYASLSGAWLYAFSHWGVHRSSADKSSLPPAVA